MTLFSQICLILILSNIVWCDVEQKFEENEIVPDVIYLPPKYTLDVSYPFANVDLGNELKPETTIKNPTVCYKNLEPNKYFTLLMVDPDAPSRKNPTFREFCHWLVTNIAKNDQSKSITLKDYYRPAPPKGTDLHRYVFLLFEQPEYLSFTDEPKVNGSCRTSRKQFSSKDFAKKYNFKELNAGNFFFAQWDESVPLNRSQVECPF